MSGTAWGPVLLTPSFYGKDGLSTLARQVAAALEVIFPEESVEIFSFHQAPHGESRERGSLRLHTARGSKSRSVVWAMAQAGKGQHRRPVVVLHAHLAPLALPFMFRGAMLYQFIIGIEVWKPLSAAQKIAFRNAQALVSVSRFSAQKFKQANPSFQSTPTVVCHPGIGRADHRGNGAGASDFALIVGRMSVAERYKGHDLLLAIWSEVLEEVPSARLSIVGSGDDRQRLEEKARSLGLGERVRFHGALSDEDLARLYDQCSFLVMPSRSEGFGLVFLEAMRAAKACIGALGAAEEIILDGETGFLVDPEDRVGLRRSIVELFRDQRLREMMGKRGAARFRAQFTEAHFQARFEAVLQGGD